ncbi:MAG TPA: hypothetical protein VJO32_04490 [Ktedonobacteraceae bacterium]|nr:hypothetical protein [Ktedonobacteraceae bacterium]
MADIERSEIDNTPTVATESEELRRTRKRGSVRCSICARRIWFSATHLIEPLGVPEPRQSWTLCKRCHELLLAEMERSPVLSPLRLRIAMGIVAADRSPYIYAPTHKPISDRTWIIVMAWGFGIAMLLHLVLIVMLAFVAGH